jgi:hypothetical protein
MSPARWRDFASIFMKIKEFNKPQKVKRRALKIEFLSF